MKNKKWYGIGIAILIAILFVIHHCKGNVPDIRATELTKFDLIQANGVTTGNFQGTEETLSVTGTTNNWAVGANTTIVRVTSDATRTVTGIDGGVAGRILVIMNVGSNEILFDNENGSSDPENRLRMSNNTAWDLRGWTGGTDSITFEYDGTTSRWRQIGFVGTLYPFFIVNSTLQVVSGGAQIFNGNLTLAGGQVLSAGSPSANHGSLGTGSTDFSGNVTGIGANTSVVLTYSAAFSNRSRCNATANTHTGFLEDIVVSTSNSAATFSCFDVLTGSAANCEDFTYQCVGQ